MFSRLPEEKSDKKQFYKVLFKNTSDNRERFIHHQCEEVDDPTYPNGYRVDHHYFEYKLGLNIDKVPFNPSGSCKSGGLYFTTAECLHNYFHMGDYIAFIEIPPNARVYKDPSNKFRETTTGDFYKADQIFISKIIPIHEFLQSKSEKYIEKLLKQDGMNLKYIENQTDKLVKIAINQNPSAFKFVKNKTFELCKFAVSQCGNNMIYLPRKYQGGPNNTNEEMKKAAEIGDCFY